VTFEYVILGIKKQQLEIVIMARILKKYWISVKEYDVNG
jgi:hypothetical protein